MSSDSLPAILEIAHNAFVSLDPAGIVVEWNPRAEELFGYTRGEAIGRALGELIVPERHQAAHGAGLRRASARAETGRLPGRLHVQARRRDGRELPVDVSVTAIQGPDGIRFHGWIQDVSERAQLLQELEALLRAGRPGFGEILDTLAEAVTIRDPHDHIIYANLAALRQLGFASLEELQRRPPRAIIEDYIVQDEHGREVTMGDIPSVRLLAGERAEPLVLRTVNRRTGQLRWEHLKSSVLHDRDGELVAAVTIIEDITREKTAELRDRFLARATETLMSSLDYEETLRNVTWLAVPEIADWCAVDLVDERGRRQQVAVAHRDPGKLELARRLRNFEPRDPDPDQGLGRVLRTGIAELYGDIADEALVAAARSEEHLELLRAVGLRSVLLVPLRARGRTLGVMTLVSAESMRRFEHTDLEFAETLANRAAVAVDNARLATSRREIAATLQRSLLPEVVPSIEGWEIATMYRAASSAEEVEVGGDFYDFVRTSFGWVVVLGDVTGKGVEAAAMTSLVRHGAQFLAKQETSPSRILARLNDALREQPGMWLCSALCASLHEERVVISSAGHPAPYVIRADGRIREIGVAGPILGAWTDGASVERSVPIAADETLFLFTDGVIDTRGESERFGADRLRRVLRQYADSTPSALLSGLERTLQRFGRHTQSDDTAAVALRPLPTATAPAPSHIHPQRLSRTART